MDSKVDPSVDPKHHVGIAAIDEIQSGMVVGLGTGSTARHFINALADALRSGRLRDIRGVPTSIESDKQARELGIPIVGFSVIEVIDVTVDGADEIDPHLNLIKGLGGALLREKIVAQTSRRLVIIADATKRVPKLGTKSPLPIEVTQFGVEATQRYLRSLDCTPTVRMGDGKPFITDNGNFIIDCRFISGIEDATALQNQLRNRAGIVETGLFLDMTDVVIMWNGNSVHRIK